MNSISYSPLALREFFHLQVLRYLGQKLKPGCYVLKGGVNLRFFFASPRYSEDMDLDVEGIGIESLQDTVMAIVTSRTLREILSSFGIANVAAPDMAKAKQTETTQRFKIHLITSGGEDLYTKVEFSRRGIAEGVKVEPVRPEILRKLRLPPLLCPHYGAGAAIEQKIGALAGRSATQARDIFDLYLLDAQAKSSKSLSGRVNAAMLKKAVENIYTVDFSQFQDTVVSYFSPEEQALYNDPGRWDEIRLTVSRRIEELL